MPKNIHTIILYLVIFALVILLFVVQKDLGKLVQIQNAQEQTVQKQTVQDQTVIRQHVEPQPTFQQLSTGNIYQHIACGYFLDDKGVPATCPWGTIPSPCQNGRGVKFLSGNRLIPQSGQGYGLDFYKCNECGWIFTSSDTIQGGPLCPRRLGNVFTSCPNPSPSPTSNPTPTPFISVMELN
jgi:hypothetical protein